MIQNRKGGMGTRRFFAAYDARGGFAAKSHTTTTQYCQLRRLGLAAIGVAMLTFFLYCSFSPNCLKKLVTSSFTCTAEETFVLN